MKERMPALILVFAVVVALVINSRGRLIGPSDASGQPTSVSGVLFSPDGYSVPSFAKASTFALAFFGYLLAVSFVDETDATLLTAVLVLGALVYNEERMGSGSVLGVLFPSKSAPGAVDSPVFNPFGSGAQITPTGGN